MLLAALAAVAPAQAATYSWGYSDPNRSGLGTLTVTGGAAPFTITDITGTFAGNTIIQLITDGSCCGAPGPDNLFLGLPGPLLTGNGMAFITFGPGFFDILYQGNGSYAVLDGSGVFTSGGTFTASLVAGEEVRVPEPASVGLLALGIAGLAGVARHRRQRAAG